MQNWVSNSTLCACLNPVKKYLCSNFDKLKFYTQFRLN